MAERFYINCDLSPGLVTLDGPEAHHLAGVCRIRERDVVHLFNGDGKEYPAEVRRVGKRAVDLEVLRVEAPQREVGHRLEIAAPLPKGDRAAWLVEKLTELGATAFTPLQTARSVVHPREAKLDKLQRQVVEASKQCGRNRLMQIGPLTPWTDFLQGAALPERRFLAHPSATDVADRVRSDVVAAVGPEGGFTEDEVEQARAAGWRIVALGLRILRVETAAIALAALLG
jgi:16S rRNA (uracil1498-N3)-methyltransferase